MTATILLDVDGVLNPISTGGTLTIAPARAALVRELAALGEIVWATSYPGDATMLLGRSIGLPTDAAAIAFPRPIQVDQRHPAPTPKLHWVDRWLARSVEESDTVVWIDDQLMSDAAAWAEARAGRTLLVQPDATSGLTSDHAARVRKFLA